MPPSSSPPPPSPSPPPPAKTATGPSVGPGAIPGKICASSQPVLLVIGAARSGTSALAHLLHLQGAYAGELGSKHSDDRHPNIGSYELQALTRLLSAMLASRKQSWLACQEVVVPNASDRRDAALLQAGDPAPYRTAHSDQRCGRSIEPAELRLAALLRRLASNETQPPAIWPAETCPPRTTSGAQL